MSDGPIITLDLPWPPACLTPNSKRRLHWRAYRGPAMDHKNACFWIASEAAKSLKYPDGPKSVRITFHPPDARRRDEDGAIGAFKHGRDGIAAALGHDDSTWNGKTTYTVGQPHRPFGKVIVEIEV
jgi:crossover junction endodeoxyribonuclease RusA